MAAWKRLVRLETDCGLSKLRTLNAASSSNASVAVNKLQSNASSVSFYSSLSSNSSPGNRFDFRQICQLVRPQGNGNRAFLVDTLKLVISLSIT